MDPTKLAPIGETAFIPFDGEILERNQRLCGLSQKTPQATALPQKADIWVAPENEIQERTLARQPRVRPRLESRPSFPDSWNISMLPPRPENPSPPSPKSPAAHSSASGFTHTQQPQKSQRPILKQKPYSEADLSLRRYKPHQIQNARIITELEWAATLEANQKMRAELDGFRVRFDSVVDANDLKEARSNAKKSPWRKTKGFFLKHWKSLRTAAHRVQS